MRRRIDRRSVRSFAGARCLLYQIYRCRTSLSVAEFIESWTSRDGQGRTDVDMKNDRKRILVSVTRGFAIPGPRLS